MYCSDPTTQAARVKHRCTWCSQDILPGERYLRWISVDDSMYTNKMHPECHAACNEEYRDSGDNEYHPYDNERPPAAHRTAPPEALGQVKKEEV